MFSPLLHVLERSFRFTRRSKFRRLSSIYLDKSGFFDLCAAVGFDASSLSKFNTSLDDVLRWVRVSDSTEGSS